MQRRDIEDITHVLARRKWLIGVAALLVAVLSVVYAGIGSGGVSAEVTISIDEPVALTEQPAVILDAGREAARLSDLVDTLVDASEDVAVRADLLRRAVVVRASAETEAEAETLASAVSESYVEQRRAEFADDLELAVAVSRERIDALEQQIDELDDALEDVDGAQSSALRDQRLQLVQSKLEQQTELAAVELTVERGDVGLTASAPTATGSTGGSVGLVLFAMIGGLLGLLGGCALALALDSLDHRLYTRRDVEAVAAGAQHVAVVGRSDLEGLERSELALLERVSPSGSVIVRAPHQVTAGDDRLDELGFPVVADVSDVPEGSGVIVAVRHGATTDIDLVHRLTALDVSGSAVAALLLYDVPRNELDWARRR